MKDSNTSQVPSLSTLFNAISDVEFLLNKSGIYGIIVRVCRKKFQKKLKIPEFVKRFIEVCGSSRANDVKNLLGISYQAAKNYLAGRLPESGILLVIAERTPYSIDWLLTGRGEKFVEDTPNEDTLLLSGKLQEFVRRECREIINEMLSSQNGNAQSKAVAIYRIY